MKVEDIYISLCVNGADKSLIYGPKMSETLGEQQSILKIFGNLSYIFCKGKLVYLRTQDQEHGMILICYK
jgi:hypothetical protein